MVMNYKEISRRITEEEISSKYKIGARIVNDLVNSLEREDYLPAKLSETARLENEIREGEELISVSAEEDKSQISLNSEIFRGLSEDERIREFGKILRNLRQERGLTQNELAKLSKIADAQYISRVERGVYNIPRVSTIKRIAEALELNSDLTQVLISVKLFERKLKKKSI